VQPLNPTKFSPVTAYDASYQASVRSLDKSLTKNGAREDWFPKLVSLQVQQYRIDKRL
jgi:hypothetical protein